MINKLTELTELTKPIKIKTFNNYLRVYVKVVRFVSLVRNSHILLLQALIKTSGGFIMLIHVIIIINATLFFFYITIQSGGAV